MKDFLRSNSIHVLGSDGKELSYEELATVRALRTGQPVQQYEEVIRQPDGTMLPILFNAVALSADLFQHLEFAGQGANGALVVLQDIAPLKATEQLKDEFIGVAAHELRNPLTALKGFVEMLLVQSERGRGGPLADWQQETLQEIATATDRLKELMEALLDVTRIQAGRLMLALVPCDLVTLVKRVVRQMQNTTQQHTIRLRTELESVEVSIDSLRIEQVLTNLLHNAVKYSPTGEMIEVTIQLDKEQRLAVVSVQDQGLGIPADQQQRLFQRFARAHNTQGIIGAGLGLYLCRELVERHGGRIWFESIEGQGSTFFIALPSTSATDA
jgi:two-component system phosphate regulon sensor histidine kinase PhoR